MNDLDFLKLQQKEFLQSIEKRIEQNLIESKYKNCKCNNCVWGYKEAHYCPLSRCIQKNK